MIRNLLLWLGLLSFAPVATADEFTETVLFEEDTGGFKLYRIPGMVVTSNGTVHLLYCVEYMRCFVIGSRDDGLTWTEPVEITRAMEPFQFEIDWQVIATGPGHGVQLRSGRLVAPFWMTDYDGRLPLTKGVGILYSDDRGATCRIAISRSRNSIWNGC